MDKEELLKKSRDENNGKDLYAEEIMGNGMHIALLVSVILAVVLFFIQLAVTDVMNYALYAVVSVMFTSIHAVMAVRLKTKHEIVLTVLYGIATLALSAAHIFQIVNVV